MAHSPNFDLQKHMVFALFEIVTEKNKKVLRSVLEWGTPRRQPTQPFCDYLLKEKQISGNTLHKAFNKSQRNKMMRDPSINSFDVSLLSLCIQYGCDGLAPPKNRRWVEHANTLERNITSLRACRNDVLHEEFRVDKETFLDKMEELRGLLTDTLKKAAEVYNRDEGEVDTMVEELNKEINSIRDRPWDATETSLVFDRLCESLRNEGKKELRKLYKKVSSFSPSSNLINKKINIRVEKIYTKMMIRQEDDGKEQLLTFRDLLSYAEQKQEERGKFSTILLVEGVAGVGKTTLTRKMLNDWAAGSSAMKNLTDYEFAIWTECRDGRTRSLAQLLQSLMPNTSKKFQTEHQLVGCLRQNVLLFIIDGLDELNSSSAEVLKDILALGELGDITILCTTRPNKVHHLKSRVPDTFNVLHVKLVGIAEEDRGEFVTKYFRALQSQIECGDITGFLQYLKKQENRLQEHLRLPFNLVLLTILWCLGPDPLNQMTTETELFMKTEVLCQKRLEQRLVEHEQTKSLGPDEIHRNVNIILKTLRREALINHCSNDTVLCPSSIQRLRDACDALKLPAAEMLESFLVHTTSLTDDTRETFSFPHKSLQDFFGALHIEEAIMADDINLDIPRLLSFISLGIQECNVPLGISQSILAKSNMMLNEVQREALSRSHSIQHVLEETLREISVYSPSQQHAPHLDLNKWQNILLHLVGLLCHRGRTVAAKRAVEIVKLLEMSGVRDSGQWLDFLSGIKCDVIFSRYIVLRDQIKVTDGRMDAFLNVVHHAETSRVVLDITNDPQDMSRLKKTLGALQDKSWEVELLFRQDFRNLKSSNRDLDATLQNFFMRARARVLMFRGQLSASSLAVLPRCLQVLHLAVRDGDHYRNLLPSLSSLRGRMPRLNLGIHVDVDIDEASLQTLPQMGTVALRISGVEEEKVEKTCRIARALQPSDGFFFVIFPGVLTRGRTFEGLIEGLGSVGVQVNKHLLTSPPVDEREDFLKDLTRRVLRCELEMRDETEIW